MPEICLNIMNKKILNFCKEFRCYVIQQSIHFLKKFQRSFILSLQKNYHTQYGRFEDSRFWISGIIFPTLLFIWSYWC